MAENRGGQKELTDAVWAFLLADNSGKVFIVSLMTLKLTVSSHMTYSGWMDGDIQV